MRLVEIITSMITCAGLLFLFSPQTARLGYILIGPAIVAAIIQIVWEGPHWQLLPLYVALLVYVSATVFRLRPGGKLALAAAIAGITLILATVALSWLMPMFRLPKPTGSFAVGTRIVSLVDWSRPETYGRTASSKRELVVQAWYPLSSVQNRWAARENYQRFSEVTRIASYRSVLKTNSYRNAMMAAGPFPVLLYNPGWMGERTEGTYQMEELASHGFFVVAIDHTFFGGRVELSDGRVVDSRGAPELGNFEHSTAAQQAALGAKFVKLEAADDSFVLDQLEAMNSDPKSPWFGRLDLTRVGAMGFSLGGAVATQAALDDKRIQAAVNLDGWSFGDVQQQGLNKPWMIIYEDKRETLPTAEQLISGPAPRQVFWKFSSDDYAGVTRSMQRHGGYILFFADTQHVDFTDRSLFSPIRSWTGAGTLGPVRAHALINQYVLAFFSQALKGSHEPLLDDGENSDPAVEFLKFPRQ